LFIYERDGLISIFVQDQIDEQITFPGIHTDILFCWSDQGPDFWRNTTHGKMESDEFHSGEYHIPPGAG